MNLADVFTVVLIIVGVLAVFVGVWLLTAGLFPAQTARSAELFGTAPLRCFLVGAASLVPLLVAGIALGRFAANAPLKVLSVLIFVFTVLGALAGTAGLALRIGRGLASARDAQEPWRRVLRGGIVLAISYGTLLLLPLTLVPGFGAFVLSLSRRAGPAAPETF
jgi:hypothetical protein